ncbi:MAG TPA: DNA polymerase III subunit gamma/tau [Candidatus Manganitrophaceae bacterium]|nr:DNA polymerase III subunit gamma/tau [Candidatus Manganitrophaceae bacterium]
MDYQVSARKWRPQAFEEMVGQRHVATSLTNAIRLKKVAHAYLFSGVRGVGKTSLARILAKALNCTGADPPGEKGIPCNQCDSCREITEGRSVDVIEIDGASNTGVEDIRELREKVKYLPLRGKYKVYIIDEVHMLSNAAFNALLKTLEEPPAHLVFIFATTESHKIPATILSRCQHFTFRRIARSEIVAQLRRITETRKVRFTERGLILIAKAAEGSMRDALSFLDQAISYGGEEVSEEDLFVLLGRMGEEKFHFLIRAIQRKETEAVLGLAKEIADHGYDLRQFLADWMEHLRHIIVAQNVEGAEAWIDLPSEEIEEIRSEALLFSREELQRLFSLFARLQEEIRNAPHPHLLFEVALMKAILLSDLQPVEKILERLDALGGEGEPAGEKRLPPVERTPLKSPVSQKPALSIPPVPYVPPVQPAQPVQKEAARTAPTAAPAKSGWGPLLSEIKQRRPTLGSYLEQGTLLEMDEQKIKIGYSGNFFLMDRVQSGENREWIASFFKEYFKKEVALVLVTLPGADKSVSSALGNGSVAHPLIQEVLKVLGGEVIETKQGSN